ncbi:MAG: DUF4350 domain-containing protein [Marinifilaceae bacterium]
MKVNFSKNIILLAVLFIGLFVMELLAPSPIDWTPNFNANDKRPFGDYILHDLLQKDLFPEQEIEIRKLPAYNYPVLDSFAPTANYIYITQAFDPAPLDCQKILNLARKGNQVFLAADELGRSISDSLGLKYSQNNSLKNIIRKKSQTQNFENPSLRKQKGINYTKAYGRSHISRYSNKNILVLGCNEQKQIQFVKIKMGKGNVYLNTQPLSFTNYYLLWENNADYVYNAFSYLPNQKIIWDEYYKPNTNSAMGSPLQYILNNRALKKAYYLLLIILILYLLFQGKRKQRVIPILKPLPNTTLEFIHTVGRLYYNRKNHKDIALKKFKHLQEFIRSKYHIEIFDGKENQFELMSKRSGIAKRTLSMLFEQGNQIQTKEQISDEELEAFNSRIEYIYKNCI